MGYGGTLDPWDADGWQRAIFLDAGLDPDTKQSARVVAEGTPGLFGIYTGKGLKLPGDAALFRSGNDRYIALRSGISLERKRFAAFHEIAEYRLRDVIHPDIERCCNAIAGACAMPRAAFWSALRALSDDPHALANEFTVTPTAAALRIGEVTQLPLVVVTRSYMWIRGREFCWPDEAGIRIEARRRVVRPGLRKIQLEDRRIALAADGTEETA